MTGAESVAEHPSRLARRTFVGRTELSIVMPGLVPGIHALRSCVGKDVDGRDKPGHDKEN